MWHTMNSSSVYPWKWVGGTHHQAKGKVLAPSSGTLSPAKEKEDQLVFINHGPGTEEKGNKRHDGYIACVGPPHLDDRQIVGVQEPHHLSNVQQQQWQIA